MIITLHFQTKAKTVHLMFCVTIHQNLILARSFHLLIHSHPKTYLLLANPYTSVATSPSCIPSIHCRKLPRLVGKEPPAEPIGSPSQPSVLPLDVATRSIKSVLMANTQVVYERLFANSLPQHERTSYFLTEVYNIKELIRHKEFVEKRYEVSLQRN